MSHEHYPPTPRTRPGSTPAQDPGARRSLEEQRAEGDLPGAPTEDAVHGEEPGDDRDEDRDDRRHGVPPSSGVPEDVAAAAAERQRAQEQSPQHAAAPDVEPGGPEPRRPVGATGEVAAQQDVDPPVESATPEHPQSRATDRDGE